MTQPKPQGPDLRLVTEGGPYRTSPPRVLASTWRAPDYDSPQKHSCPKCNSVKANEKFLGWTWPTWCRGSWWRRLLRWCPDGEHMHQSCTACKAKWTTGLEKSE